MFCTKCGNEIAQGTKFCTKCGSPAPSTPPAQRTPAPPPPPVRPAPPPRAPKPEKTGGGKTAVIIAVIVALAVVACVLIAVLLPRVLDGDAPVVETEPPAVTESAKPEEETDVPAAMPSATPAVESSAAPEAGLTGEEAAEKAGRELNCVGRLVKEEAGVYYVDLYATSSYDAATRRTTYSGYQGLATVDRATGVVTATLPEDVPAAGGGDYLLPSDSRYITEKDLDGLTQEQVALARNEVYARHGLTFKTESIRTYFEGKSWYRPVEGLEAASFNASAFNEYEKANVEFILSYEQEKGWRT